MNSRKTGLTLGKFAPLHRGHQLVIETALAEMDEVILLIYDCPEATDVPLDVRAGWIRELYPTVSVIDAWDGPTTVGDTPEITRAHDEYILRILSGRQITHFYSSEFYGEHVSRALGAVDRRIDPGRQQFSISGTLLRQHPYQYRDFIPRRVYRDLIAHVVFLGAPSSGKTTMAERMAQEFGTVWMPEYGREYWEQHQIDRRLSLGQLVEIAEGHLEREEKLLDEANRFLFTDTNALTTYVFSLYYHRTADQACCTGFDANGFSLAALAIRQESERDGQVSGVLAVRTAIFDGCPTRLSPQTEPFGTSNESHGQRRVGASRAIQGSTDDGPSLACQSTGDSDQVEFSSR